MLRIDVNKNGGFTIVPRKSTDKAAALSEPEDFRTGMTGRSPRLMPRYVEPKPLKSGWGYFFNVPTWARKAGCPIRNEALGLDYEAARTRAENVLLPAFDSWRSGGASDKAVSTVAAPGTLDWVFAEYRADRRFAKLDPKTG